jgi:hypothetical protein
VSFGAFLGRKSVGGANVDWDGTRGAYQLCWEQLWSPWLSRKQMFAVV